MSPLLVFTPSGGEDDASSRKKTSRDIVQDAFVAAWKNLGTFDVTRDFGSWMRGIVRNKWRESLRKNSRQIALDEETLECLEADAREWDGFRDQGGVFVKLEGCLKKLPETNATLRKRLERARTGLRECLQS